MAAVPRESQPEETPKPALTAEITAPKKKRNPLFLIVAAVLVVVAVIYIVRYFSWASVHVSTDDATVASDVINISPQVAGTVVKVYVKDNAEVKKGTLLAELEDSSFKAAVAQAKANYDLAVAQSKGAVAQIGLTGQIGNAQILQAQGGVEQTEHATQGTIQDVQRTRSAALSARAQASGATAGVRGAEANLKAAQSNKQKALDAVAGAQSVVASAESAVKSAQANEAAAEANYQKAQNDNQRAQSLLTQGAISAQEADQAGAAYRVAEANYHAAQQQVQAAQSTVTQRQAEVATSRSQVAAADAAITQAEAQIQAAKDQAVAAQESVNQAQSQTQIALSNVQQSQAKTRQARGTLAQANTAPVQVEIQKSGAVQADAKVEQALAALKDAEIQLSRTKLYAPVDGRVSHKTVEEGALVSAGTPLMSIVPVETVWVTANFKETQLAKMRVGELVDVEVDAVPSHTFKGHVESISAGTGSTFALLPADNATGNFTKVVQRVPVKISLDPNQKNLESLRTGMSVTATVSTP